MRLAPPILASVLCSSLLLAPQLGYAQERQQLLEAAEQLQQMGLGDAAAKIRGLAGRDLGTYLYPPALDKSGAVLDVPVGCIKVNVVLYEYQPARLEASGLQLVALKQVLDPAKTTNLVDEHHRLTKFLEVLRSLGLAEVVAAPVLLARDGQTATLAIGAQPTDDAQTSVGEAQSDLPNGGGLRCDCTPKLLDGNRIRIDVRVRRSTQVQNPWVVEFAGDKAPKDVALDVHTQAELRSGQTLIIAGARRPDAAPSDAAILVLVTATGPPRRDLATSTITD